MAIEITMALAGVAVGIAIGSILMVALLNCK